MKKAKIFLVTLLTGYFMVTCSNDSEIMEHDNVKAETENLLSKKSPALWADCVVFATIDTKTRFKPTAGNFDELYTGITFKDGLGAISESKPGDKDYNGGRWHVNRIKANVSPDKYLNACSVEELDLDDFMSTPVYFECPMRPIRGNSGN
jgi:hypothetical protein